MQELIDDLNIGRNRGVSEPRLQQAFNDADADHDGCVQGNVQSLLGCCTALQEAQAESGFCVLVGTRTSKSTHGDMNSAVLSAE